MKKVLTLFCLLLIIISISKGQPTQGLVAYYPFSGNTNDESGNGWNGTGTDLTLIQDRFGNVNSAYYFNGFSSSIDFGLVPIPIANFSISMWINSNEADRGVVLLNAWLDKGFAIEFLNQDGTISFEVIQSSSINNTLSVPVANNSWHHLVATCDNDIIKLFFDGELIVSQSGPVGTQSNEKLSAGFDHSAYDYYYDGGMDDIRVYNRVLNENEILGLYYQNGWVLTGIENDNNAGDLISDEFVLYQNYPNPFNPSTTIGYFISEQSKVSLIMYDILGKELAILVNEEQSAGNYSIELDGSILSSGVYFYKLQVRSYIQTKKMILLR